MGKKVINKDEQDYTAMMQSYAEVGWKNAMNAFAEGYLMGTKHAKKILEDANEN